MKSKPECLDCILNLASRAAGIASTDPAVVSKIIEETARAIPAMDLEESPGWLSLAAFENAKRWSGNPDPYRDLKHAQNEMALALEPDMRVLMDQSEDRLLTALHLAAAGNVIDLGIMHLHETDHESVREVIAQVTQESFAVDHSKAFRASLERSKKVLYLLDNAGEIVFDKILIEELLKSTSVTAVVKGGPIINDALMADAEQVGLTQLCEVIDNGGAFIGAPLHAVSKSFLERMRGADMIVAKGQGNYETVDTFPGDVFLILRAKCNVIAQHMGVQLGQVGLVSTRVREKDAAL